MLAEHTTKCFKGLGGLGVCLFFSLSGFFLIKPFIKDSNRILSSDYMAGFIVRRIMRILPMYGIYLFVVYFLAFRFDTFFRHLFFLQGDKHLWTMPQEMFFYLLIPLILLVFHLLRKINIWFAIVFFPILMGLAHSQIIQVNIIHNATLAMDISANIGIFLGGMLAALLFSELYNERNKQLLQRSSSFFGICGIFLLLGFSLLSTGVFGTKVYALSYPFYYDFLALGLILCVVLSEGTLFNRFLASTFLRAVGLVSFSFYLVHFLIMKLVRSFAMSYFGVTLNEIVLMIIVGIVSYFISVFTYSYIERPCIYSRITGKTSG